MAEKPRILVMDDEEALLRTLKIILPMSGYEIETAAEGKEAIALYQKAQAANQPFTAVLLDLNVPSGMMGGLAAAKEIQKIDPQARLVACSGDPADDTMINYKTHGFITVMIKPYDVEEIRRILKEVTNGE